jgi:ABC-type sugar transport system permease subunit
MGLIKNALNKLKYKAFQASYDPAAEKYAAATATVPKAPAAPAPVAAKATTKELFVGGFLATFFSIIGIVLLFFLCILAGSLAANDAIGRSATIRTLYFIYAALPIFTPFVLVYYIYRYFKGTYPLYYNMLPLTTSPGSSWLVQCLKWAFYYVPDANSAAQELEFIRLGKSLVAT